jgi:hypothetical protein
VRTAEKKVKRIIKGMYLKIALINTYKNNLYETIK